MDADSVGSIIEATYQDGLLHGPAKITVHPDMSRLEITYEHGRIDGAAAEYDYEGDPYVCWRDEERQARWILQILLPR